MKSEKLFSYGSLQLTNIQLLVFGKVLAGKIDSIIGYKQSIIKIKEESNENSYPILLYTGVDSDIINGKVFHLSFDDMQKADDYETDIYKRVKTSLVSGGFAWVYVKNNG